MALITIIGQFDIHPGDASAAAELMRVMAAETNKEPGCHHYSYARDLITSNRFQLSEIWEDATSLEAHFETTHMATYRAGLKELRVEKRTVRRFEVANVSDL